MKMMERALLDLPRASASRSTFRFIFPNYSRPLLERQMQRTSAQRTRVEMNLSKRRKRRRAPMKEGAAILVKADDAYLENNVGFRFLKMWYGCLPSATVIVAAMSVPHIVCYLCNTYILGNPYKRYLSNKYEWHTYLRDMRLGNGDPYKQLGLDYLRPDKDEEKCKCP